MLGFNVTLWFLDFVIQFLIYLGLGIHFGVNVAL